MGHTVLISAPYFTAEVIERYRQRFDAHEITLVVPTVNERMEEDQLLALPEIGIIDGIIAGDDRITERVLTAAKNLKVISKWGTGIDSLQPELCKQFGVAVRNTPDAFTTPVAETVLGYMLNFVRRHAQMDHHMKSGRWEKIPGKTLAESTVGVIGVGNCGKAVLRRARAFGAILLGTDPVPPGTNFVAETGVQMVALDDLLRRSDFVSVNCDLNESSRHIINAKTLRLMKPTAVLINAARGPLVNEADLLHALTNNTLGGAALDVFEQEPLPMGSRLRTFSNVLLAPHNANSSPIAWGRVHENTFNNLIEGLKGQR